MFFAQTVNRALEVAAIAHQNQYRKNPTESIPYVSHVAMVGYVLQKAGYEEAVVAAGILHDVLEDTSYPRERLDAEFGEQILEWIDWVTEQDKSLPWETRKANYLRRLEKAPQEAVAIALADKIQNLQSILGALRRGEEIWSRFTRNRTAVLANLRKMLVALRFHGEIPLLNEFRDLVEQVERSSDP